MRNLLDSIQSIYSERQPYIIETRNGEDVYIFTDEFISILDKFFLTGEMIGINNDEYSMVNRFISHENNTLSSSDAIALDKLLVNIINNITPPQNTNITL